MSCNNYRNGNVGGTSISRCGCGCGRNGNVGGTSTGGCGCGGSGNVGGTSIGGTSHRRKCCVCYLVEPITNFLRCLSGHCPRG